MRERSRVASSSEYSGNECSGAPVVPKKFGCDPAARTSASAVNSSPSLAVTVLAAVSTVAISASLTSTFSLPANTPRSECAMSLGASCEVATW